MGLDDRLGALRAATDDPVVVDADASLISVRGAARRRHRRRQVVRASLVAAVVVLLAGVASAVVDRDDAQRVTTSTPEGPGPPPIDPSMPHLWLSAETVPPAGADLAVAIVDPTASDDIWGVDARLERWDGTQWTGSIEGRLCLDEWGCVGGFGGDGMVQAIGLGVGPVGPLTWVRTGSLDPGWYRIAQQSNEGTVAAGQFEVRAGVAASPPRERGDLEVVPVLRSTGPAATAAIGRSDGEPLDDLDRTEVHLERWESGRWTSSEEGFGPGFLLGSSTVDEIPGAEAGRHAPIDLGLGFLGGSAGAVLPGAYRLTLVRPDGSTLLGRFWVADPTDASGPGGSASEEEAWGAAPGERTPVGGSDERGNRWTGYVNWDVVAGRAAGDESIDPIYAEPGPSSDEGTIVGYWGIGVGWIDKDRYESSDLDDQALLEVLRNEEQEREGG